MKKNWLTILAILFIVFISAESADAQRRRSRRTTDDTEQAPGFGDRINYEIRLGNLGFGSGFAIAMKPSVGFKINKYITAGTFFRADYEFYNGPFGSEDFSYFNYGPGLLLRGKFIRNFYLQGEYTFFSFDEIDTRASHSFPSVGLGMVQGGENWKYNIEVFLLADDFARNTLNNTVEFWFSFSKNF